MNFIWDKITEWPKGLLVGGIVSNLSRLFDSINTRGGCGFFIVHIPPYTPEMNPIEQIWREIRTCGFRNEVFHTLDDVVNRLCETICSLTPGTIHSIIGRGGILSMV